MNVTTRRNCVNCEVPISECMGYVKASDFMEAIEGKRSWIIDGKSNIRELCGKCSQMFIWNGDVLIKR